MIESLLQILPIIIYMLLIILIIIFIVIGIKFIATMNKVENIVDNCEKKINSLNGIFDIIEMTSGKITGVYERVIDFFTGMVEKIFTRKKERNEEDE